MAVYSVPDDNIFNIPGFDFCGGSVPKYENGVYGEITDTVNNIIVRSINEDFFEKNMFWYVVPSGHEPPDSTVSYMYATDSDSNQFMMQYTYNGVTKTVSGSLGSSSYTYNGKTVKYTGYKEGLPESQMLGKMAWLMVYGGYVPDTDPYKNGGSSVTGGGTGTFDRTGDDISVPAVPTLSAVSTGFVTLYNPTLTQLNNLASYMWSDLFDINTFKKIFADPMDVILGLSMVPVSVPDGGTVDVKVGNISTGVFMNKAASQFVHVSCGSIEIKEYWGAYLDFAPYTKAEIYLPYCGSHPIDIDEIMGKTISVDYNIDIFSGSCCAMIKCGNSVLYHFLGQCSQPIPVSGNDWSQFISNAIRAAASIGTMVATAGASAPATAAGSLARTTGQISSGASTAESIVSMKPSIEKSGAMCGGGGMLGVQTPYITFNFPRQCLPKWQNTLIGYPSYITSTLGELSGYTIIDDLHLMIDTATNQEKDEIEELLKGGVIL